MKSVIKACFVFCFSLLIAFCFCFDTAVAQQLLITIVVDTENSQNLMNSKSIDDLLGPDTIFPFDPANHRDGSNPIKRIGKISDENL